MTTWGQPQFFPSGGPAAIRDGAVAVLTATGYFKNVFRNKTTPTKDDQLPFAAVWMVRDETSPMGDDNVGTPSFDHTYTLCIDVGITAASDDALTAALDDLSLKTRTALLCDADWRQTFEGVERCSIHPAYPKDTNLIFVQASIEVVVTFRSIWPPYLPNQLNSIGVVTNKAPGWTCSFCQSVNASDGAPCGVCASPAPSAAPVSLVTTDIELDPPQ